MICGICLDRIYLFYHKCNCKCNSYYHKSCINNWYKIRETCPICKKHQTAKKQEKRPSSVLLFVFYLIYISSSLVKCYALNLLFTRAIFSIMFLVHLVPVIIIIIYYLLELAYNYFKMINKTYFIILSGISYVITNIVIITADYKKGIQFDYSYLKGLIILNLLAIFILTVLIFSTNIELYCRYIKKIYELLIKPKVCCICKKKIYSFYLQPACNHTNVYYHHSCKPWWVDTDKKCPLCHKIDDRTYMHLSLYIKQIIVFNFAFLLFVIYKNFSKPINFFLIGKLVFYLDTFGIIYFIMVMIIQQYVKFKVININDLF